MGYNTDFTGQFTITPPLSAALVAELTAFAQEDHRGEDAPGVCCDWAPSPDGTSLRWTGSEKSYSNVEWVQYLIDHYFMPHGHVVAGHVDAQGERMDDRWRLVVRDGRAERVEATATWPGED